jgi:[protein-PII] uridylyltransferase
MSNQLVHNQLRAARKDLEVKWAQGLQGHELQKAHAELADNFIIEQFLSSTVACNSRGRIAVIALGGYGREELYPFSDIDLLLLHDPGAAKDMKTVAESILYPLWDGGFEVGHSVRGVKDTIGFAKEDFFFKVALLDARLIAGSESLFKDLLDRYQKKIITGKREQFVATMEQFRAERRAKYGSHSFLLEPHIKEGKGGMRDIQAMLWVSKAVFGLSGIEAMSDAGMLTSAERIRFMESWDMLAMIRNRLHYISRHRNDQLIFEYQEDMAEVFSYKDSEGQLAVEQFMRLVYGHLQTIAVVTDIFFEHVGEVLRRKGKVGKEEVLEQGIIQRWGSICFAGTRKIREHPYLLMRIFFHAGRLGLPIHHRSRQLISENLDLVDGRFRSSKRISTSFLAVLEGSGDPVTLLGWMLDTGFLSSYVPEFSKIESLVQHDLYHVYTVDRHQVQTVAEVHLIRKESPELFAALASPQIMYLSALLHDIGKGRQDDHSRLGSVMVVQVGERLGLNSGDRELLSFLVRYHLFLPENGLRRDPEDRSFIMQAAELIGDANRLSMLYILAVADSRATGPSAWSGWKASMLSGLFVQIRNCLSAPVYEVADSSPDDQDTALLIRQVVDCLAGLKVKIDVDKLPEDYLRSFTSRQISHHLHLHSNQGERLKQQALLFAEPEHNCWSLLMLSRDRPGLLAKLCGVLSLHNLSVLGARVFTWPDNTVVDLLEVKPVADIEFKEQNWQKLEEDLNLAISYRLDIGMRLYEKSKTFGMRSQNQVQRLEKKVVIDNNVSERFTVISVHGADNRGTLYRLTVALSDFGLNIHRARIATEVEQLIDVFYITVPGGEKLKNKEQQEKIQLSLLKIVDK